MTKSYHHREREGQRLEGDVSDGSQQGFIHACTCIRGGRRQYIAFSVHNQNLSLPKNL